MKRVTSADAGTVEDPEGDSNGTENQGSGSDSSSQTGDNTQSGGSTDTGGNQGGGSTIPGEGD